MKLLLVELMSFQVKLNYRRILDPNGEAGVVVKGLRKKRCVCCHLRN